MLELLRKIVHIVLRVVWVSILGTNKKSVYQDPTTEHMDRHFRAPLIERKSGLPATFVLGAEALEDLGYCSQD